MTMTVHRMTVHLLDQKIMISELHVDEVMCGPYNRKGCRVH